MEVNTKPKAINFNKPAYVVFILAGIYFMLVKDFAQATIFWGLGLVFDPFNIKTPFNKRPFYQQAWLIVHLLIAFVMFYLEITKQYK